jgi:ribose-phosphate pyrophosphokinase
MTPVVIALPENNALVDHLVAALPGERGYVTMRRFPDGESYVRVDTPVSGRHVVLVSTLVRPDDKILPLLLLAATVRDLGAASVGLVAPYLCYLRQDNRFRSGEGLTAAYFGRLLSQSVDWLVTVDPHLHRYHALSEVYSIPTYVAHAAPVISGWIRAHVRDPILVGPDSESAQWVDAVASEADAPYVVLDKIRRGDRDVEVSIPDVSRWKNRTPVVVDDIISTARTLTKTVTQLRELGFPPPVCVGVHAIFAGEAYSDLQSAGAGQIVTCNTVPHASNAIDVGMLLVGGVRQCLAGVG